MSKNIILTSTNRQYIYVMLARCVSYFLWYAFVNSMHVWKHFVVYYTILFVWAIFFQQNFLKISLDTINLYVHLTAAKAIYNDNLLRSVRQILSLVPQNIYYQYFLSKNSKICHIMVNYIRPSYYHVRQNSCSIYFMFILQYLPDLLFNCSS